MFTVVYNVYEGETQVFGMFSTYKEALEWMRENIKKEVEELKNLEILNDDFEPDMSEENFVSIENIGDWEVVSFTEVSKIR